MWISLFSVVLAIALGFGLGAVMLETDGQSRVSLQADDTGKIDVDPSTRLRLLSMGSPKEISLAAGLTAAEIKSGRYTRISRIRSLIDAGQLDLSLRWSHQAVGA